jgi:serine/threonine protein kinase
VDFSSSVITYSKEYRAFQGTHLYTTPEWIEKHLYHAETQSTWTLGVILYSLIYGMLPFRDEEDIMRGSVYFPKESANFIPVSEWCRNIIRNMLHFNPYERATLSAIRGHPWTQHTDGVTLSYDAAEDSQQAYLAFPPARNGRSIFLRGNEYGMDTQLMQIDRADLLHMKEGEENPADSTGSTFAEATEEETDDDQPAQIEGGSSEGSATPPTEMVELDLSTKQPTEMVEPKEVAMQIRLTDEDGAPLPKNRIIGVNQPLPTGTIEIYEGIPLYYRDPPSA